jgi:hypothetical protein
VAVTIERMTQFLGTAVTAAWCGPGDGDGREDGMVPGCSGDSRAAWTQRQ